MKQHYCLKGILLCLCLFTGFNTYAYDAKIDGIYYNFSGNEATVTYQEDNWYHGYTSDCSGDVVIPEFVTYNGRNYRVTNIGNGAFSNCSGLTSVTIPSSVTSIGGAFRNCSELTSIVVVPENTKYDSRNDCNAIIETALNTLIAGCQNTIIPNSVTSIGGGAFSNCSGLTSITIPNGVTCIGGSAFAYCSGLTSVTIPNSVTSIGDIAFYGTPWYNNQPDGLVYAGKVAYNYKGTMPEGTHITIENGTLGIASSAFSGCSGLTSVTIPNSVTTIGEDAFYGCSGLTSITIPSSVTSIGIAFSGCCELVSIEVAADNPSYDSRNNCNAIIETATNTLLFGCKCTVIPNSVTSIGNAAFTGCSGLSSITIPNSVTSIGDWAFQYCSGLRSITISESVTRIGYSAFSECNSLSSITIPNSVTTIGDWAFSECSSLTSITIPNSVTSIGVHAFGGTAWYDNQPDGLVYAGKVAIDYKGTIPEGHITFEDGTLGIAACAFMYRSGLTSITVPNSVTSIGYDAFYGTTWYNNQPNGLVYAGKVAYGYKGIMPEDTHITIEDGTLGIAGCAFRDCSDLNSVTIPNSVTNIGYWAFSNCSILTDIYCHATNVPETDRDAFYNSSISSATLHVPASSVEDYSTTAPWSSSGNVVPIVENTSVTIGSAGFATYCSECDLDFSEVSGLTAYIASGFSPSTGKLVLTRVTEVPAGEGLYLVGDEGRYNIPATTTDMLYSNLLKGVTTTTTIYPTDGSYTNFILANGSHGVAFYSLSEAGELAAGKAYLQLPTASVSEVKAISVIFDDDDATGIASPLGETGEGAAIYNLQGQQVNAPKSGLYIINGKKVFIK